MKGYPLLFLRWSNTRLSWHWKRSQLWLPLVISLPCLSRAAVVSPCPQETGLAIWPSQIFFQELLFHQGCFLFFLILPSLLLSLSFFSFSPFFSFSFLPSAFNSLFGGGGEIMEWRGSDSISAVMTGLSSWIVSPELKEWSAGRGRCQQQPWRRVQHVVRCWLSQLSPASRFSLTVKLDLKKK